MTQRRLHETTSLVARFRFPDHCLFTLSDYGALDPVAEHGLRTSTTFLHPSLFTVLKPCFTYGRFVGRFTELLEDAPLSRVQTQLQIDLYSGTLDDEEDTGGSTPRIFADVRVLVVDRLWTELSRSSTRFCPAVQTLVLHGSCSYMCIKPLDDFSALEEIWLVDPPFNVSYEAQAMYGLPIWECVLGGLAGRKNTSAEKSITPIRRLVLYGRVCISTDTVARMREAFTVELRTKAEYEEWESALRHRALADLRSGSSWLPRSASECMACNGRLEEYAREEYV